MKNRKIWIPLILGLWGQTLHAEQCHWERTQQLHPHMIPFQFQLCADGKTSEGLTAYLKILTPQGEYIQTLAGMSDKISPEALSFIDTNFDHYLEMRIQPDPQKNQYRYWTYDRNLHQFVENKTLGALKDPKFDEAEKVIVVHSEEGLNQNTDYYRYDNNELTLFKQEQVFCQNESKCEKTLLSLENGVMKEISTVQLSREKLELSQLFDHLLTRKKECLAPLSENKGSSLETLQEARSCLIALSYELVPEYNERQPESGLTLKLKTAFEQHYQLMKSTVLCPNQLDCLQTQEKQALEDNIRFIDATLVKMVAQLGHSVDAFDSQGWLAKWHALSESMQS